MFSQSILAQLFRMTLLLCVTLFVVHQYPALSELIAEYSTGSGCHQHYPSRHAGHH